ncbi:CPBP family intramembrane metalloprotease [Caulobacter segnis]|uniref:CPBP family intramembrane glutamic endopeptidase, BDIM_20840 family n=1 Tax=Caulobacter segnis TaxID=88688 RepID=UPI0024105910|nr:CPBP family intramembrane glutamic endopeptidase [Caulobacter segnis]MDG2521419.1 CPBP family intramembrane metalloprotease [Caulobacter segnis]
MNSFIGILGVGALLLATGGVIGATRPSQFSLRWLLVSAGLVLLIDFLLTRGYGLLPNLIPLGERNWQGMILALAATLAVASTPAFGWRASYLTPVQAPGSVKPALLVSALYMGFFLALALVFPNEPSTTENLAFQMTMPGLMEEAFYRGVLLLALGRAFTGRVTLLGVDWSWGAILSCALFGLAHAFGFSRGGFSFDPLTMALTAMPSLIAVWIVLRTRSILLPIVLHNFGNTIMNLL